MREQLCILVRRQMSLVREARGTEPVLSMTLLLSICSSASVGRLHQPNTSTTFTPTPQHTLSYQPRLSASSTAQLLSLTHFPSSTSHCHLRTHHPRPSVTHVQPKIHHRRVFLPLRWPTSRSFSRASNRQPPQTIRVQTHTLLRFGQTLRLNTSNLAFLAHWYRRPYTLPTPNTLRQS